MEQGPGEQADEGRGKDDPKGGKDGDRPLPGDSLPQVDL